MTTNKKSEQSEVETANKTNYKLIILFKHTYTVCGQYSVLTTYGT